MRDCASLETYLTCGFLRLADVWGRDYVLQKLLEHTPAELLEMGIIVEK
jgi:hypothetical protein